MVKIDASEYSTCIIKLLQIQQFKIQSMKILCMYTFTYCIFYDILSVFCKLVVSVKLAMQIRKAQNDG
jgi:hypothetical protein